jgi:hypothetical protein
MNWKSHIAKILPRFSRACFPVRLMYPYGSLNMLNMIYFAYFHSIINYGIVFGEIPQKAKKYFWLKRK